jgi:ActR/RegA family two-component response regulator
MPLRSLLFCRHSATVQFINRTFKEFSIDVETCSEPQAALQNLKDQRFEAVVIDAEDRTGAMLVLDSLKALPSCKNSLRVVLADNQTVLATAFSTGTHLVIYKPISADRLRNSLRALCPLMSRKLQREFHRIRVRIPAIVHVADKNLPASILDISQGGVALTTKEAIPATKILGLDFVLPGRTRMITTSATVVWNDVRGRIGAQFANIEPASRKLVCEWVAAQLSSRRLHKATVAKVQA